MPESAVIFISYAREDFALANAVYDELLRAGLRPWMDKRDLIGGQQWEQAIAKAVAQSNFFLFCASPRSVNKRGAVQREVRLALDVWSGKLADDIYFITSED